MTPLVFPIMINGSRVILREKVYTDARNDYSWEIDPELAHLDAAPVLGASYSWYMLDYIKELETPSPNSYRLAIDTLEGQHIGNCSYYNVNRTRGETELGIMIGVRDYWDKGYGTDVINTLVNHIFCQKHFKRIYLKTLESNIRAQKCFQRCGFNIYGHSERGKYSFTLMELHRKDWETSQKKAVD